MIIGLSSLGAGLGCKPAECEPVLSASGSIASTAENGSVAELASRVAGLEEAARESSQPEAIWLVHTAQELSKLVKAGSVPGGADASYHENKMRAVSVVIDARKDLQRVCG